MQSFLRVITPGQDTSLVTLYEAKLALGMSTSTDQTLEDLIEMLVGWASSEVAVTCNRVFAKETVTEVFSGVESSTCIFLSRWPVVEIDSIDEDGTEIFEDTDFTLDAESWRLYRVGTNWTGPLTITYTGGYDLPLESPKALRQASLLMTREAYYASTRGDATIRMIGHKDARVIYFDPNAALKAVSGGGGGGGSPARRAVADLLKHFMRFEA